MHLDFPCDNPLRGCGSIDWDGEEQGCSPDDDTCTYNGSEPRAVMTFAAQSSDCPATQLTAPPWARISSWGAGITLDASPTHSGTTGRVGFRLTALMGNGGCDSTEFIAGPGGAYTIGMDSVDVVDAAASPAQATGTIRFDY